MAHLHIPVVAPARVPPYSGSAGVASGRRLQTQPSTRLPLGAAEGQRRRLGSPPAPAHTVACRRLFRVRSTTLPSTRRCRSLTPDPARVATDGPRLLAFPDLLAARPGASSASARASSRWLGPAYGRLAH